MNTNKQQHIVQPFNVQFDIDKAVDGLRQITVIGIPNTGKRKKMIERAIEMIQNDPEEALLEEYIGYKNYASFGDQEVRCRYGMVPTYGSVVFRIGRTYGCYKGKITEEAVYLLQCVRDFGYVEVPDTRSGYRNQKLKINFCDVLSRIKKLQGKYDKLYSFVKDFSPELVENQDIEVER